jgi:hypothetical protein
MKTLMPFHNLFRYGFLSAIAVLNWGCSEKAAYQSQLVLKNELTSPITVKLFPKGKQSSVALYTASSDKGVYQQTEFSINPGSEYVVYVEKNATLQPDKLTGSLFDSISVQLKQTAIYFAPNKVKGYKLNPFINAEIWQLKKVSLSQPTQFKENPITSDNFIFTINQSDLLP